MKEKSIVMFLTFETWQKTFVIHDVNQQAFCGGKKPIERAVFVNFKTSET